jgi:hypothetical protein
MALSPPFWRGDRSLSRGQVLLGGQPGNRLTCGHELNAAKPSAANAAKSLRPEMSREMSADDDNQLSVPSGAVISFPGPAELPE